MAPHSSTLAWKIPWMEGWSPWGRWGLDTTEWLPFHFSLSCIGEGNGNPLQCSCLENLRDGGAWWAAVYGVAQSRTRLKQLSSSSSSTLIYRIFLQDSSRSPLKYISSTVKMDNIWGCADLGENESCDGSYVIMHACMLNCFSRVCLLETLGLLCPWDSPGKNTWVGCHALLQGIFQIQGSNPCLLCLLHWQACTLLLVPPGKSKVY